MAGDRRATMGSMIANREIEKVFAADEYSAVGIAGSAGLAVELVKLFQVELEHYEKIEGAVMSLEGKANRLATMIRGNLGLAMQGLAVVPLFAGYDLDADTGRIFSYDVTGGCYEERDHHGVGSGSLFARGALKKLWRPGLDATGAVRVALEALYDAADDDSATGGPDLGRRIWPVVATMDSNGFRRVGDDELTALIEDLVAPRGSATRAATPTCPAARRRRSAHEHAVLRLARAADEGPGRLRPQGDRPRPLGGRHGLRPGHLLRRREPVAGVAQGQRDLRPDRVRRRREVQRVREPAGGRRAVRRPARVLLRPQRRHRARAGQRLRADARARSSPRSPSRTRSRSSWPRSATGPRTTRSTG